MGGAEDEARQRQAAEEAAQRRDEALRKALERMEKDAQK